MEWYNFKGGLGFSWGDAGRCSQSLIPSVRLSRLNAVILEFRQSKRGPISTSVSAKNAKANFACWMLGKIWDLKRTYHDQKS